MKIYKKNIYKKGNIQRKIKYFLGLPYCETIVEQKGEKIVKHYAIPYDLYINKYKKEGPFFYLKVNSMDFITIPCLQHWIDTINEMNGDFVIVCDKDELKAKILKQCCFYEPQPKFIKSYFKPLKSIVKNICRTKFWIKATHAHLTTFYHAQKYGIKNFWNIDADDTMIFLSKERTAEMLRVVQEVAEEQNIDAYSLDMHLSETFNNSWTFGVTYIRNSSDWMKRFYSVKTKDWSEKYLIVESAINCDSLMDDFKHTKVANIKTFYAENLAFCHYANIFSFIIGQAIHFWKNGILHYPLYKSLDISNLDVKISNECDKLNFNIQEEESIDIARKKFLFSDRMKQHRAHWSQKIER